MTYPPADDRLRHLLAQRINCHVDNPEIRAELARVAAAHASGEPCGDRNCRACFEASTA